jgi:hypothetical protein
MGIHDVNTLGWALRARSLWLQRIEPKKPWTQFQIQISREVQCLFDMAVVTVIGDQTNTISWKDK